MLDIFRYAESTTTLTEAEEAQLIADAQAGSESAKVALIEAYARAVRAAISRFKSTVPDGQVVVGPHGTASAEVDDVQQAAMVAVLEAIADHDPTRGPRLAGHVVARLDRELTAVAATRPAFQVPSRTLSRFYGIMAEAEGDLEAAIAIAPSKEMSAETLKTIYAATGAEPIPTADEEADDSAPRTASPVFTPSPVADVEDRMLVDMAFAAMTDEEARICELAYGFTEYDPIPDPEIAHRMGLSRPAVQRKRAKALDKSRKAIGVTLAEEV
jgi:DNA-directed RNA polymerase specialized sigma subunit